MEQARPDKDDTGPGSQPGVSDQLLKTEKVISSLLLELNELKQRSDKVFIKDYEERILKLEKISYSMSRSLAQAKAKADKYYKISQKLTSILKEKERLEGDNALKREILTLKQKHAKLLSQFDAVRGEARKEIEEKLLSEIQGSEEKVRTAAKYRQLYEKYYKLSKKLAGILKEKDSLSEEKRLRSELALANQRIAALSGSIEDVKSRSEREAEKRYASELSDLKKKLAYFTIAHKANVSKADRHYRASAALASRLKKEEKENAILKDLIKEMDDKIVKQSQYHMQKVDQLEKQKRKAIEDLTKRSLERELELNAKLESVRKDFERYYKLYNEEKRDKLRAFDEAKSFFDSKKQKSQ